MNWLKVIKIKIMMLIVCLSALCFGEKLNDIPFNNLLNALKEAEVKKFEQLYLGSKLTAEKKKELLTQAKKIIAYEWRYWRSYRPIGSEISIGKKIKRSLAFGYSLCSVYGVCSSVFCGHIFQSFLKKREEFASDYYRLQNNLVLMPLYSNAASVAQNLDLKKSFWLNTMHDELISGGVCAFMGIMLFMMMRINHKILCSYKRWRKSLKIKQLIEQPLILQIDCV